MKEFFAKFSEFAKAAIGMCLMCMPYYLMLIVPCYFFVATLQGSIIFIGTFLMTQIYLTFFCRKSTLVIDLLNKLEIQKWFNSYEIIYEEPLDPTNCLVAVRSNFPTLTSMLPGGGARGQNGQGGGALSWWLAAGGNRFVCAQALVLCPWRRRRTLLTDISYSQ